MSLGLMCSVLGIVSFHPFEYESLPNAILMIVSCFCGFIAATATETIGENCQARNFHCVVNTRLRNRHINCCFRFVLPIVLCLVLFYC